MQQMRGEEDAGEEGGQTHRGGEFVEGANGRVAGCGEEHGRGAVAVEDGALAGACAGEAARKRQSFKWPSPPESHRQP